MLTPAVGAAFGLSMYSYPSLVREHSHPKVAQARARFGPAGSAVGDEVILQE